MLNVVASLKLGTPLSVTRRMTAFVLEHRIGGAFQVKRPFRGIDSCAGWCAGSKVTQAH